ncbi:hypothetical protein APSETT445_005391 [Aspergillus pseudonomiae]
MPQRGNSDLHLYSRRVGEGEDPDKDLPLVHSFPGHKGQVKEFLWRARGGVIDGTDHRDFQLVSWGTDRELRLHRADPDVMRGVGYEKGKSFISNINITRNGAVYKSFRDEDGSRGHDDTDSLSAFQESVSSSSRALGLNTISVPYARPWTQGGNTDSRIGMQGRSNLRTDTNPISWMRGVKISGWDVETLGDEITHVGEKFTKVDFDSVDVRQRKATISLHGPWGTEGDSLFLKVDIKFPADYPRTAMPTFSVQKTSAVTDELADKLVAELRTIAETFLSHKRGCLEGVVRYLLDQHPKDAANSLIQWGDHPFGGQWLVPALFEHFERVGDVQMVAMLSCVLHESDHEKYSPSEEYRPSKPPRIVNFTPQLHWDLRRKTAMLHPSLRALDDRLLKFGVLTQLLPIPQAQLLL